MTGYVSTRYYRAPEIMLTWQKYDVAGTCFERDNLYCTPTFHNISLGIARTESKRKGDCCSTWLLRLAYLCNCDCMRAPLSPFGCWRLSVLWRTQLAAAKLHGHLGVARGVSAISLCSSARIFHEESLPHCGKSNLRV